MIKKGLFGHAVAKSRYARDFSVRYGREVAISSFRKKSDPFFAAIRHSIHKIH